jgi:transposase
VFASPVFAVFGPRCQFFELPLANQSLVAGAALPRISDLYEIESRGRNLANAERQSLREREARPKLQARQDWLQRTRDTVADGSRLARAMGYSLKRWPTLSRYARRAILPIDHNPVENIIRPIALGKKNGLFTARRALRDAAPPC